MIAARRLAAAALLLAACAKTSTFRYERTYDIKFPDDDVTLAMTDEARQALSTARTVAFAVPDHCDDCGATITALERAAEQAGFRVVPFRGAERPLDYAKQSGVDILFEIDKLALSRTTDRDARADLAFFSQTETGSSPITPARAIVDRCESAIKERPAQEVALSATLDIRMVRVSDGQGLWHYRRTRGEQLEESAGETYRTTSTTVGGPIAIVLGGGTFVGGIVVGTSSLCPPGDYTCEDINGYISKGLLLTGAVVGIVGVVKILANGTPDVDDVLCAGPPIDTGHIAGPPTHQAKDQKLRGAVVADFLKHMSEIRRTEPQAQ